MPEPAGDVARNAAALVESFAEADLVKRAVVMATAANEYHREDHCPGMGVAMWLAARLADIAAAAEVDLAPMLARWREAAEKMDAAAGGPSPN